MAGTAVKALGRVTDESGSAAEVRDLVDRCVRGDQAAWKRLFRRYWPTCHGVAERVLSNEYASYAPDVAQEVFLAVFRRLGTWQGGSEQSFSAWIRKIARRRAQNFRKLLRRWSPQITENGVSSKYP